MGTHLYISHIEDETKEVAIPFLCVALLENYRITKKEDLSSFLNFHRMRWECGIEIRKEHLEHLNSLVDNAMDDFANFIIQHYQWENNVAFNRVLKESNRLNAAKHMMKFEIERHNYFGITPEVVSSILEKFVEGIHFAFTV